MVKLLRQFLLAVQYLLNSIKPVTLKTFFDRVPAPLVLFVEGLGQQVGSVQSVRFALADKLLRLVANAGHLNRARCTPFRPTALGQRLDGKFVSDLCLEAHHFVGHDLHLANAIFGRQCFDPRLVDNLDSLVAFNLQERRLGAPTQLIDVGRSLLLHCVRWQRRPLQVVRAISYPHSLDPGKRYRVNLVLNKAQLLRALGAGQHGGWHTTNAEVVLRPNKLHFD
mmetsp:Transcript_105448/g.251151  ORF Transcript_105448/g.251151 Transcript_105448/m.251151 type:complete len:224 (-) Transcript_105448:3149-3820(-)